MSYADRIRSTERPNCWGNSNSYDPHDPECVRCRYQHSCSTEINRGGHGVHINTGSDYRRTNYKPRDTADIGEAGAHQAGMVEDGEKPIHRFAKDAVSGGLRGMFYEMWQFWRHYRIR